MGDGKIGARAQHPDALHLLHLLHLKVRQARLPLTALRLLKGLANAHGNPVVNAEARRVPDTIIEIELKRI